VDLDVPFEERVDEEFAEPDNFLISLALIGVSKYLFTMNDMLITKAHCTGAWYNFGSPVIPI